jgi:single-strand DNA-binding protein
MGSVNKVILVGNLGRDAEVKVTASGQSVASFSIATTETWTKDGEKKEKTEWHRIVLWGRQADTLQPYLTKGKQIYVEGRLETRQWEGRPEALHHRGQGGSHRAARGRWAGRRPQR